MDIENDNELICKDSCIYRIYVNYLEGAIGLHRCRAVRTFEFTIVENESVFYCAVRT